MIVFRCDASADLGMGHLMRCRALASSFRTLGLPCLMIGPSRDHKRCHDEHLFVQWIEQAWQASAAEDAKKTGAISQYFSAKYLVLDDPRIDQEYQKHILDSDIKWLQFDGGHGKKIWADYVVNASPAASASLYKNVLQRTVTRLLLGPKYAIVREEFAQCSTSNLKAPNLLLVMFGGGDDRGAMQFTLEAVIENLSEEIRIIAVSGKNNPRNEKNVFWIQNYGRQRIHYLIDPSDLPSLMAKCSAAVLAGGTSTYEVNLCELPMVLIAVAENQIMQSKAWHSRGHAIYLGEFGNINTAELVLAINQQLNSKTKLPRLVDGLGGLRVASAMLSTTPGKVGANQTYQ